MAFHSTVKSRSLLFAAHTVFIKYINSEIKLGKERKEKKERTAGDILEVHTINIRISGLLPTAD